MHTVHALTGNRNTRCCSLSFFTRTIVLLSKMNSYTTRLVFVAVALLTAPIVSKGQQCDFPTLQDVERIGGFHLSFDNAEGGAESSLTVHDLHFTCLARVAFDKYSHASVVVNSTSTEEPDLHIVRQFELACGSLDTWTGATGSVFDRNIPPMPFDLDTEFQCAECTQLPSTVPNYNASTNCYHCLPDCLAIGGGFCTGLSTDLCCPFFNRDTGDCEDDCTRINPNFLPNESFVCVCQISCQPGYTNNTDDCICELTDGCLAFGHPCQNGGSCTSDVSAPPYYSCQCSAGYTGQNCQLPATDCDRECMDGHCDLITGCCAACQADYVLENNCSCVQVPTTEPPAAPTEPIDCDPQCMDGRCDTTTGCCATCQAGHHLENNCNCVEGPTTDLCPTTCLECKIDNPTCCSLCPEGLVVHSCLCTEEENGASIYHLVGLGVALLLFILLIMTLSLLLSCALYHSWATKKERAAV